VKWVCERNDTSGKGEENECNFVFHGKKHRRLSKKFEKPGEMFKFIQIVDPRPKGLKGR
jgi:hypothetical protein